MTIFGRVIASACLIVLISLAAGYFFLLSGPSNSPTSLSETNPPVTATTAPQSSLVMQSGGGDPIAAPAPALYPATPGSDNRLSMAAFQSQGLFTPAATPVGPRASGTPPGTVTIPILMYHYVRVVTDPSDVLGKNLSVTPSLFEQQMQYLQDHEYTTLTLQDVYAILSGKEMLPLKPVALTFDDGYEDFYSSAWPVLKEHNLKATSYIITGFVGGSAYMTWDQIRELDATGMVDFGAHTEHHVDLQLLGPIRLWNEIDGSKLALEQQLGHPVTDFDYPSGEYNSRVIADVRQAGFDTAVTTHYGDRQNLKLAFTMPRIRVTGPNGLRSWIANLPQH